MLNNKRVIGIIPARGGSKGLPEKNIRSISGKPLIAWAIEHALSSKYLDKVIVSTEDNEIARIAQTFGADVPFMRSEELATDEAGTIDVTLNVQKCLEERGQYFDAITVLQPISPLRRP